MVLGVPDEYHEDDAARRLEFPIQTGSERVQHDWPLTGLHFDYPRWVQLHRRHFSFVPVFLRAVMDSRGQPLCRPVLREVRRPVVPEFRISGLAGYSSYGGGSAEIGVGFDVDLDLERKREWQAFLGLHGSLMMPLSSRDNLAFLAGARAGLKYRSNPVRGGLYVGGFVEQGIATETSQVSATSPTRQATAFVGVGAQAGYSFAYSRGSAFTVGAEGGAGIRVDREALRWYRLGLSLGLSF